ncbi:hypothetical protein DCC81_18200 [Chitinophaga parva]|uniref:AB hydrolase-1 domain-containing protein n=1 Tax=Chitinophaga parva TaxID=2169414 RepID=A0A2T7BIQ5_9BACT|nr:alpha/beta hydrolase [Chitinophaga parva]PUZ26169.1 hypothetical protein DCC81_18200 [Chitinophaga parva]
MQYFLTAGGLRIHYHRRGSGPRGIIFIPQASGDGFSWQASMESPALADFQRVYIDPAGHGQSAFSAAPDEDYTVPGMGATLAATIAALQLTDYILVTASLGSNIAAEALPLLHGCKGLFMVGPCVLGQGITPAEIITAFPYAGLLTAAHPPDEDLQHYMQGLVVRQDAATITRLVNAYRNTDPQFRVSLGASLARAAWSDEISNLQQAGLPVAIVFGENEAIVNMQYLDNVPLPRWQNQVHVIKAAGHLAQLDQPAVFEALLCRFIADVF